MGWAGRMSQVEHYLGVVGADRDEEGKFLVAGTIASFMGVGVDVVVGDDAVYLSGVKQVPLAPGLCSTSYGVHGVKVY